MIVKYIKINKAIEEKFDCLLSVAWSFSSSSWDRAFSSSSSFWRRSRDPDCSLSSSSSFQRRSHTASRPRYWSLSVVRS